MRIHTVRQFIGLFRRILKPGDSLSSRVLASGFWVLVLRVISQVLSLTRTIVLARLLAPSDFGLIGITMVVMSILETFSQTGFQSALIQKKEDIEDYLDTAWTALAARGALLYALLFFAAPYAAAFYETPEAGPVIRAAGLVMLINGLMNIRVVYFKKELEFQKQFLFLLAGTLADLLISIAFALALQSIWALVYGLLAGSLAKLVISYIIAPYRPRIRLDVARLKDLYGYGRWIFWTSVFIFFLTEGDDAFLGKVLGVTALGFYQMAHRISNLPATEITHVISQVTFPAYAKLQDNPDGLREAYLRVLKLTSLLSIPAAAGIFILAPELTGILLGEKWMPMVPVMRVMVIGGAVRSIGATMGPVFQAVGRPEILSRFLLVQVLLVAALIYPLTVTLGLLGTGLTMMISGLIVNCVFAYQILKITGVAPRRFFQAVGFPLLGSLIMGLTVFLSKTYLLPASNAAAFALHVIAGAGVYFAIAYVMELRFDYKMRSVFRSIQV